MRHDPLQITFYATDNARWRFLRLGRWYERLAEILGVSPTTHIQGVADIEGILTVWYRQRGGSPEVKAAATDAWGKMGEIDVDHTAANLSDISVAGSKSTQLSSFPTEGVDMPS
tara:strand:- start:279 stop:620 length:342 start_codon:yes stop_codon:yes gene_type:complete